MWAFKEKCWHKKNIYILMMLEISNEITQALFHILCFFFFHTGDWKISQSKKCLFMYHKNRN